MKQLKNDILIIKRDVCSKQNRKELKKAFIEFLILLSACSFVFVSFIFIMIKIWAA